MASKTVERAFEAVDQSRFNFLDQNTLEIQNAFIFWTNFRGEANKFGNNARTFNVAVNQEVAEVLEKNGWRVRPVPANDEGDMLYFINVKVNMISAYPPVISLFSEFKKKKSKRTLTIENIGDLDRVDIQSADCVINAYASPMYQGKVTGYLKKLNVIQEPDIEFGGKYDDWLDDDGEPQA